MSKDIKRTYYTPPKFTNKDVRDFLKEAAPMFNLVNKRVPGVVFDTRKTNEASLVGLLLIYKFMEFSNGHNCFEGPTLRIKENLFNELETKGFRDFIKNVSNNVPIEYDRLKFSKTQELFIAPVVLRRDILESTDVLRKIAEYYNYDGRLVFAVLTCVSEISSNFISHAVSDSESVLVAQGNKKNFELVCADTGDGIISTLRPVIQNGRRLSCYEVIMKAIEQGISSKRDNKHSHMGYGLWLINGIVSAAKGELLIVSEGAYYHNCNGKIKKGDCSYWKGTIICIKIPLSNRNGIVTFLNTTIQKYKKYNQHEQ